MGVGDNDDDDNGLNPWMGPLRDHRLSSAPPPPSRSDKRRVLAILALVACCLAALLVLGRATSTSEREIDTLDTLPIRHHEGGGTIGGDRKDKGGKGGNGGRRGRGTSASTMHLSRTSNPPTGTASPPVPASTFNHGGGLHPVDVYDGNKDDGDNGPYDAFDYEDEEHGDGDDANNNGNNDDYYEASLHADAWLEMMTEEREAERKE